MAIVPAHRQIVFFEAMDLVETIFLNTMFRLLTSWAVKTEFAQTVMRNLTEMAREGEPRGPKKPVHEGNHDEF